MGGVNEKHLDSEAFAFGTHLGVDGAASLYVPGADFKSCGVQEDVLIKNTTDESSGTTSSITENTVVGTLSGGTNNYWSNGDEYEIYLTDTEDSLISSNWTDKRYGRNYPKQKLYAGLIPKDIDKDEFRKPRSGPR